MRKLVVVTGIPGVGKSTVLKKVVQLSNNGVKVVNYGTVMLKIAEKYGKTLHRDFIRTQSVEFQRKIQEEAAQEISNMAKDGTVIVDTHMIIKTKDGYLPGLPHHVLRILNPNCLIIIEADPNEIVQRREMDKSRVRDRALVDEIYEELMLSRSYASACSVFTGAPLKIIKNPQGKIHEAANELLDVIKVKM